MESSPTPSARMLVLLGCRTQPQRLTGAALRRAERCLQDYRHGAFCGIVVCGGKRWHGLPEATALARHLEAAGVPRRVLELELNSRSTLENALYCSRTLKARGLQRIGLVTCDYHMERARRCFERQGFEVEALAAASPSAPRRRAWLEHLSTVKYRLIESLYR